MALVISITKEKEKSSNKYVGNVSLERKSPQWILSTQNPEFN